MEPPANWAAGEDARAARLPYPRTGAGPRGRGGRDMAEEAEGACLVGERAQGPWQRKLKTRAAWSSSRGKKW